MEMKKVILKCHKKLNDNNLNEFLKEWECHTSVLSSNDIINFHGFTGDPNISKYMVVMDYANKVRYMKKNLIHCDFHDGNILNHNEDKIYISDLCPSVKSFLKEYDIYGVMPFMAPEVLRGERPEIIENTPQCYLDLMKKCWNEDSSKRPSSKEVLNNIKK
ncbi:unnamed protein product [Rhizophagus irregularis]|nr:unnamed protein product [Rhizophagus irregularis]